ncbi:FGFR1 oncogene partner 2 homolog isoform X1 [Stegodyphus dumicola]|uniref:FGFR1 oncogene partner 2 homolog isoform X1 n=2 Tax=Stegodyphus dumicola TaxID=202533 RepID=UPI0015AF9C56|nr:FGFR1 oncogene partner 2 homolog isoform X1 [Stegodyphus dumicola]XP_035226121.1 FGFR1 oncogene partner 2 homolog isoform X1 [Stegodyphus dumicola]XP_035226122.1 FGFR1 oncogene partner 2 homolog isoform X1 [Stegodyphus dumicola]
MSVTVQQLLNDAKRLVTRLREHDNSADSLISQAQTLNNNVETMKQYHEEVEKLNALAHQRPRSALILNIQQENRHIRELQQENRELKAMLEEHQSALELIMNKYRQQIKHIAETAMAEQAWVQRDSSQELQKRTDKIIEMSAVMQKAVEIDEKNFSKEQEIVTRLEKENSLIRDLLELNMSRRSDFAQKAIMNRTDECIQTDL